MEEPMRHCGRSLGCSIYHSGSAQSRKRTTFPARLLDRSAFSRLINLFHVSRELTTLNSQRAIHGILTALSKNSHGELLTRTTSYCISENLSPDPREDLESRSANLGPMLLRVLYRNPHEGIYFLDPPGGLGLCPAVSKGPL